MVDSETKKIWSGNRNLDFMKIQETKKANIGSVYLGTAQGGGVLGQWTSVFPFGWTGLGFYASVEMRVLTSVVVLTV